MCVACSSLPGNAVLFFPPSYAYRLGKFCSLLEPALRPYSTVRNNLALMIRGRGAQSRTDTHLAKFERPSGAESSSSVLARLSSGIRAPPPGTDRTQAARTVHSLMDTQRRVVRFWAGVVWVPTIELSLSVYSTLPNISRLDRLQVRLNQSSKTAGVVSSLIYATARHTGARRKKKQKRLTFFFCYSAPVVPNIHGHERMEFTLHISYSLVANQSCRSKRDQSTMSSSTTVASGGCA